MSEATTFPLPGEGGRGHSTGSGRPEQSRMGGPHPCLRGFRALSPKAQALALTPAERAALLRDGSIVSICPSRPRLGWIEHARAIQAVAAAYWAAPARPHGLVKSLCIDHGLDPTTEDYRAVLQAIERHRPRHCVA